MKIYEIEYSECFSATRILDRFECKDWRTGNYYRQWQCNTSFWDNGCLSSKFFCPKCGTYHEKKIGVYGGGVLPKTLNIRLFSYKNEIILRVDGYGSKVEKKEDDLLTHVPYQRFAEEFRFNFKTCRSTWRTGEHFRKLSNPMDFTNPLNVNLLDGSDFKSVLSYISTRSIISLKETKKSLLIEVQKRLEAGKRKPSEKMTYLFSSSDSGQILPFLKTVAFKIAFPDLAVPDREIYRSINSKNKEYAKLTNRVGFYKRNFIETFDNKAVFEQAFDEATSGKDSVTAWIEAFDLPNKPFIRKAIKTRIFSAGKIKKALEKIQNYDLAAQAYKLITVENIELLDNRKNEVYQLYGDRGTIQLLEKRPEYWSDTTRMIDMLSSQNRVCLFEEKPKLKELHDWLVCIIDKQSLEEIEFDIPPEIKKRMEFQMDRVKFFLPETNIQLHEAGNSLSNCLSSYSMPMERQETLIVLVSDKRGKLSAALRISDGEIVEAKVAHNDPVSSKPLINAEIIKWAEKVKLKIKTRDIAVNQGAVDTAKVS